MIRALSVSESTTVGNTGEDIDAVISTPGVPEA